MSNFTANPQQPQQQGIKVDPNAPNLRCPNCGNQVFQPLFIAKKISAIVSPTGKEGLAPLQIFACTACGAVPPEFGGAFLERDDEPKPESQPQSTGLPKLKLAKKDE